MKHAQENVDISVAGRSSSGLVHAGVYIQIDESSFPNKTWSDFAVVINSWWCEAALRLLAGKTEYAEFRFMEGPYLAEVSPVTGPTWQIKCVEVQASGRVTHYQDSIDSGPFVQSLLDSAEAILDLCRQRNWWNDDAETLKSNASLLQERFNG